MVFTNIKVFNRYYDMQKLTTLSLIKPDAVTRNLIGKICTKIENAGLKIIGQKMLIMSRQQAMAFYDAHKERPFFEELVGDMISGAIVAQVLYGDNAITKYRDLMGATNPSDALEGTIRKEFAISLGKNSVHGSDSPESAKREIAFIFAESALCFPE